MYAITPLEKTNKSWKILKILLLVIAGGLVIIAVLGYLFWQLLFSGFVTINPDSQSGEVMVKPAQYGLPEVGGIKNFSLSPNGQWLFVTSVVTFGAGTYHYILHNLQTGQGEFIHDDRQILPKNIFETTYLLEAPGCWDPDSQKVTLVSGDFSILFFLTVNSSSPSWQSQENARDLYDYYYNCPTRNAPFEISTLINIKQISAKSIEITTAKEPQRILAKHQAEARAVYRVSVNDLVISPDGQYLAYIFDQWQGFGAFAKGYVLNLQGEPKLRLLGDQIFKPFQWSPDSMYVYALSGGPEGQSIYRWQVQDRPSTSTWNIPPMPKPVILNEEKVFNGEVIENNLGCQVDGECYLKIKTTEGQEMKVVYHYGTWPNCINQAAANTGETIQVGSHVRVFGRIIADFNIHTCPSSDFYIRKEK